MSIKIHNNENKTYVVLGAPHSATSLMSKALNLAGVDMGNIRHTGLFQDSEFVGINKQILASTGKAWHDPPTEEAVLNTDFDSTIKDAIKKRNKIKFWGFKDPRTAITIRKYLPYLQGDPYLFCCFRKPEKVVASYSNDRRVSRELIDIYNERIISAIKIFLQ